MLEVPDIVLFVNVAVAAFFVASLVLSTLPRPTSAFVSESAVLAAVASAAVSSERPVGVLSLICETVCV